MQRKRIIYLIIDAAIFIFLEVAALNMLRHAGTMQNIWFSKGCHVVMAKVWGTTQNIAQYFSLRKTNESLALENTALKARLAKLELDMEDSLSL